MERRARTERPVTLELWACLEGLERKETRERRAILEPLEQPVPREPGVPQERTEQRATLVLSALLGTWDSRESLDPMVMMVCLDQREIQESLENLDQQVQQGSQDHPDLQDEGATWEKRARKERLA